MYFHSITSILQADTSHWSYQIIDKMNKKHVFSSVVQAYESTLITSGDESKKVFLTTAVETLKLLNKREVLVVV